MSFTDELRRLGRLPTDELHRTSRRFRTDLGAAEWRLGLCLLTWTRSRAFQELGYSTITEYGEKALNLSGRKVGALLGAARALEYLPLLSEAFRKGEIGWAKIRVIHGLATPLTEKQWLDFAMAHSSEQVARKVALSPTAWKHHRALKASVEGQPLSSQEEVEKLLADPEDVEHGSRKVEEAPEKPDATGVASKKEQAELMMPVTKPGPPGPPRTVRVVVEFTPDQYALYEQAENRVRAQAGKRVSRAEIVATMAHQMLSQGTARSRARHQVLIHKEEGSDVAWYDTERGILPVSAEILEQAEKDHTGDLSDKRIQATGESRRYVPNVTIRALYARAGQRCERCDCRRGPFHIHHTTPVSEGGGHELEALRLLCPACHNLQHLHDFAHKPFWRLAREASQKLRPAKTVDAKSSAKLEAEELSSNQDSGPP